jgi:DNA repair exonuclease SbcCD ATPase subunit
MATELRIHKVITQANDLARNLEVLTRRTECNDAFRQQNQERMEKVWFDILNVKANLEKHLEKNAEVSFDLKEYQKEVMEVKSSMGEVRALVEELVGKVSQLPTLAEADALLAGVNAHREACEAAVATCRERTTCAGMRTGMAALCPLPLVLCPALFIPSCAFYSLHLRFSAQVS